MMECGEVGLESNEIFGRLYGEFYQAAYLNNASQVLAWFVELLSKVVDEVS